MEKDMPGIGVLIKRRLKSRNQTAAWLAEQIPCDRSNIYNIFSRNDINSGLLQRISVVLEHDFFLDLSKSLCQMPESEKMGGVK